MDRTRKLWAALVVGAFLVPFTVAAVPSPATDGGWFWPFMSYPMYSEARRPGDVARLHELRARECDAAGAPGRSVTVGEHDIPIRIFRFWRLLVNATEGTPAAAEQARQRLVPMVTKSLPRTCRIEIWERSYVIGEQGLEDRYPPWRQVVTWPVAGQPEPEARR